jgi:DegV family protein with EDD domain
MAHLARERFRRELPETTIELLDSETATSAQGFIVLAAARAVEAGMNFTEVIEEAGRVKGLVNAVVLLDTVRHVYRSGRVPRIAAQAASVLNIRPIFSLHGSVHFVTAVRSRKHGIGRMLQMMKEKVGNKPVHCAVMHAYDVKGAENLKTLVESQFECVELWTSEFSPVMGYATGTGTLGLAFYTN